jgi:hypothetical protein
MKEKDLSKGQLESRLRNALVFVPKDKDYKGVYFDDKGLRLEVTNDFAVITTGFHRHVFNSITSQGISRPYLYTQRFIEIALSNDCLVKDEKGNITRSYNKLMAVLKEKEDKSEFNVCWYTDLWFNVIFHNLYSIGETEAESFLVYESYLHNIARNKIILSEKTEDITNKTFIEQIGKELMEFTKDVDEHVVFPKKTDEERKKEEIDALAEAAVEKNINETQDND